MSVFEKIRGLIVLLSSFMLLTSQFLDAGSVVKSLGNPIKVSPTPGPANPDPILPVFDTTIDNFFLPPYFPLNPATTLYYSSNTYFAGDLAINPVNDKIMHLNISQNLISTRFIFFSPAVLSNTLATSRDGGLTWSYGPPVVQTIPLGGNISQLVNASLGPGLFLQYAKNGRLYASGNGFFDLRPNPPNTSGRPLTGSLFTHSDDQGKHWADPNIVITSDANWWFNAYSTLSHPSFSIGIGQREFYTTVDPSNPNLIHATTSLMGHNADNFGAVYYLRSTDGGKTFSKPRQVYRLLDDPVWRAKFYDYKFFENIYYPAFGGCALVSGHPIVVNEDVILLPVYRYYAKIDQINDVRTENLEPAEIPNFDRCLVRSLDKGKTWETVAGATDQFITFNFSVIDPGWPDPVPPTFLTIKGQPAFPNFFEGFTLAPSLKSDRYVVSPLTGRIYVTYEASNITTPVGLIPDTRLPNSVYLSTSRDLGATFSRSTQVNRTPPDPQIRKQQCFAHSTIMSKDGYLIVAYYDFRNWTGVPGEIFSGIVPPYPPLQTDAWLAIYKETADPTGGSTGLGLDFIEEIRLTPQSFDVRPAELETARPTTIQYATGTPEGIRLAFNQNNQLYVIYSQVKPGTGTITTGYKGIFIDTNSYFELYLRRFQFPKPSNR